MALLVERLKNLLTRERQSKPQSNLSRSSSAFMSSAQERIDENTTVSFSAVWRGLELLSGVMARMPKSLIREQDEANKTLVTSHRVSKLLRRSVSAEQTTPKWFETTTLLTLLWGQSFSEIFMAPDRIELYPLHPSQTRAMRDQSTGQLVYEYTSDGGVKTFLPDKILHITMPSMDGITGLGLMALAKHSIGLALALQKYGGALFGNDAIPGLVLEHPKELGEEGLKNLRESIESRHRGANKAHTPLILEEEMKAHTLTPPNDNMQFNETRGMQVLELARYMGVAPHLLYWLDRATFSNIEHLGIEFVKYTLKNWITRFASEMKFKLLGETEDRLDIEFDTSEIERGDSETFSKVQERRLSNGIITFNEARHALGLNSLGPDGDMRVVNKAMMDAERLGDDPVAPPDMTAEPADLETDPEPPEDEGNDEQERARLAAAGVLRDSMESLIPIECDRVARAINKGVREGDTADRIRRFYEGFGERVSVAFAPAFVAHATFTGSEPGDIVGTAAAYVETQRATLLSALDNGDTLALIVAEWRDSRADEVTDMLFGGSSDGA